MDGCPNDSSIRVHAAQRASTSVNQGPTPFSSAAARGARQPAAPERYVPDAGAGVLRAEAISAPMPRGQVPKFSSQFQCKRKRGRQEPVKGRVPLKQTLFEELTLDITQLTLKPSATAPNVIPHVSDLIQAIVNRSYHAYHI
ncbi:hypothetical protein BSZ19_11425 [Bradyrhizobium japonicum]|uniref:Uncharacterized protein n=1 Tax=Bradyrhizobium japonicum TaxID=375 RepID=A0A1Y2JSF9_BRAJP|nr:hypothetical protein [Bradyrhizobium japonicum]OSJ34638.1 hypothetical protein BSZ19_11425 [Bradyrhizobium japonicum]